MSTDDRVDAKKDDVKGKTKEGAGKLTNDEQMENEGKFDQVKSDVKEGVADAKDKAKEGIGKLKDDDKR